MYKRCLFWLSVLSININIPTALAAEPLLAVGTYVSVNDQRPLLALFNDKDKQWSYPESVFKSPLPDNYSTGSRFSGSTCKDSRCVAVGYYYNTDSYSWPLIGVSKNSGEDWSYVNLLGLGRMVNKGRLENAACAKDKCFSVGYYENEKRLDYPLLMVGADIWSYANALIKKSLPKDFLEGRFKDVQCTEQFCIAAGFYRNSKKTLLPLVMHSDDGGKHWRKPLTKKQLPKDFTAGYFNKITCSENSCSMAGIYTDLKGVSKPWVMISEDGGKIWQTPNLPLPDDFKSGNFVDINCKSHFCIAVGTYNNVDTTVPLMLYSNDDGKSWLYSEFVNLTGLPTGLEDGLFTNSACSDNSCIAVGYYHDRIGAHPLIAVSEDKGANWSYPESARTSLPNADVGDGELYHASCRGDTCIAVGNYLFDETRIPLLAISHDKGMTWAYNAELADKANLPPDFIFGQFDASS